MKYAITSSILFLIFFQSGCKKDAGLGGTSTIGGKVQVQIFNINYTQVLATYNSQNLNVFINYGNNSATYDTKYGTSYDGSYIFKYLNPGDYKIWVLSRDTTGAAFGSINFSAPPVYKSCIVHISDDGETVTAPTLTIIK